MWLNVVLTPGWPTPVGLPRSQSSGTGANASCRYCCPFAPRGSVYGKIRFMEPQGVNGHRRPVPAVPSSGTIRESQAKFRDGTVWIVEGSCGYRARGVSIRGNSIYRETRGTRLD